MINVNLPQNNSIIKCKINKFKKKFKNLLFFSLAISFHILADEKHLEDDYHDEFESIYVNNITNTVWENQIVEKNFYDSPYKISLFSPQNGENIDRLWSQTQSVFAYGLGVTAILYVVPESFSNWDKEGDDFIKWGENVKAGPLWDRDEPLVNWLGHPYFGSIYYQVARKSGYRQWDAFFYSFLMSTFYWEYGVEAIAEPPSIQDLVITPLLGWALGEWAFNQEQFIRQNGGKVWGSDIVGGTILTLLDPIDSLGRGINNLLGHEVIRAGSGNISMNDVNINNGDGTQYYVHLNIAYTFGSGKNYSSSQAPSYYKKTDDPIDYSIVGFSYGIGFIDLDPYWKIDDGLTTEYSLGMYLSRSFSTRVSYAKVKLTDINTSNDINYENYSINAQYYFNTDEHIRPFITVGIGEMLRERDNEKKVFQVNLGTGLHFKITNNIAIQTDIRHYYSPRANTSENAVALNIVYRLGKGEWY